MDRASQTVFWVFRGRFWTLPVRVRMDMQMAQITLDAVPMLKIQKETLSKRLRELCFNETQHGFFMTEVVLHENAIPCTGDPELQVHWQVQPDPERDAAFPKSDPDREEFLRVLAGTPFFSQIPSTYLLDVAWRSVCQATMSWTINHRKSVDLGWVKITALPMRANWKEMMFAMVRGGYADEINNGTDRSRRAPPSIWWTSGYMLAKGTADPHARWTVEAEPLEPLRRAATRIEARRLMRHGKNFYLASLAWLLWDYRDIAKAIYVRWRQEIEVNVPDMPYHVLDQRGRLISVRRTRVPDAWRNHPANLAAQIGLAKKDPGTEKPVVPADADLPPLSRLQPDREDVWDAG